MANFFALLRAIPQIISFVRMILSVFDSIKAAEEERRHEKVKESLDQVSDPEISKEKQREETNDIARGSF